jgi:hypothetical protein
MAKKIKQGVMPGFPKLAFYMGPQSSTNIPSDGVSRWGWYTYILTPQELVVLVASGTTWDFSSRNTINPYQYLEIPCYHFIPVRALEEGKTPITCIYKWRVNYSHLPKKNQKLFSIIERKDSGT